MIYSQWRPAKGGYDYFEAPAEEIPMGNDLPVPTLAGGTAIGVASIEAGRPIPPGARYTGSGADAVGMIAPSGKPSTLGILPSIPQPYLYTALGILVGWFFFGNGQQKVKKWLGKI